MFASSNARPIFFLSACILLALQSLSQTLVLYDEFDSASLNKGIWRTIPEHGPHINPDKDLEIFKDENVKLDSGKLKLLLNREPGCYDTWRYCHYDSCKTSCAPSYNDSCSNLPVRCSKVELPGNKHCLCIVPKQINFTAGLITTREKFHYGIYEIRCKAPDDCYASFWLYAGDCCEEIDIFEFLNSDERKFTNTIHECVPKKCHKGAGGKGHRLKGKALTPGPDFKEGFHTFTLEWAPEFISLKVDGVEVRKCTRKGFRACNPYGLGKSLYPDSPANVIINIGAKPYSPSNAVFEVEYVKIWKSGL